MSKAFVKGINILDSNPKAYKHVKKKYKMTEKKQEGGVIINDSPILQQQFQWLQEMSDYKKLKEQQKLEQQQREQQQREQQNSIISGLGEFAMNYLPQILKSSKKSTDTPKTSTIVQGTNGSLNWNPDVTSNNTGINNIYSGSNGSLNFSWMK